MTALSNVALTNTFDEWRIRTNQIVVKTNDMELSGIDAFNKTNTANILALAGNITGNAAFDKANSANVLALAGNITGNAAFDKANSANIVAASSFAAANSANLIQLANTMANGYSTIRQFRSGLNFVQGTSNTITINITNNTQSGNGANIILDSPAATSAYDKANSANIIAVAAFAAANSGTSSGAAFDKANSANVLALAGNVTGNAAFDKANSANIIAVAAFNAANTGTSAAAAFDKANSANILAFNTAASSNGWANTVGVNANNWANSVGTNANNWANGVGTAANSYAASIANTISIAAFAKANTGLANSNTYHNGTLDIRYSLSANSLGIGTPASGVVGEIRAKDNITAYYSDIRLKIILGNIENAIEKVKQISGIRYINNDLAKSFGYENNDIQVGVIAQEVRTILPEAVKAAPFDTIYDESGIEYSKSGENYMTVQYEKLIPLLIEAIKEQQIQIDTLTNKIKDL